MIKKTFNRFLAILMIVLIGAAFMMGLFSTRILMEQSVDRYDDQYNLQDIQVYSSYGFNDEDIEAIKKQEYVRECFASKTITVFSRSQDGTTAVTAMEELYRSVSQYQLVEGRMPVKDDEVLMLSNSSLSRRYSPGDVIEVYLEDEDVLDKLKHDHYTIVGLVETPAYMAKTLGTSTLKNLELETVVYCFSSNFLSDYYTTVLLTVDGSKPFNSFSNAYEKHVGNDIDDFKVFAASQQDNLKEGLLKEYRQQIEDGERELNEKKAEGQSKLDEAKKQLDDANIQIIAGQTQINSYETMLQSSLLRQNELKSYYEANAAATYNQIADIEANDSQHREFSAIYMEVSGDYGTYQALKNLKQSAGSSEIDRRLSELRQENASLKSQLEQLSAERTSQQKIVDETSDPTLRQQALQRIDELNQQINDLQNQIDLNTSLIENIEQMRDSSFDSIDESIAALDRKYNGSIAETYQKYSQLQRDKLVFDSLVGEMEIVDDTAESLKREIKAARDKLAAGQREYEKGLKLYSDNLMTFNLEIEKAENEIRMAYQKLEELPEAKWIILDRNSHYSSYMYENNATQMGAIGLALPVLFYLVAALVCMTTMTRLIDEQRGQIGIYRALGFSKRQIAMKYVIYALAATLIGSFIGIFVGMAIFPTVIYNTWRLMYDLPEMVVHFPVYNVVICFVAFSLLIGGVTWLVVNKTLSETPSQLLRPKSPKKTKRILLEKIEFIWRKLSFTSKITARNILRYKGRFIMTVIGVAGCTGLLVIGWGVKDSISEVVSNQYGQIFHYDYNINLESDSNLAEIQQLINDDLNNEYSAGYLTYASRVYLEDDDPAINMIVIDARDCANVFQLKRTDRKTELRLTNSGVIVSQKFAINHGVREGDYLTVESANGIKAQVRVSAICEMYFQHYMFISSGYYDSLFDENIHCNAIAVRTLDGQFDDSRIKDIEGYLSATSFEGLTEQFNTMIKALDYIILVIIITAGSLAFVVLTNLIQVNISERIREIATLKVLGFRTGEIYGYIFKEIMLMSIVGGLAGLPLGILEHHFIMNVINMEMIMFGNRLKPLTFIYSLAVTLTFTLIVMTMTRKTLKNVEMIESLKSVE